MAILKKDAYKDMVWKTWDDRQVTMHTITQEHLSNCYWYMIIVRGINDPDFVQAVMETMKNRFDGNILPYQPDFRFRDEHEYLRGIGCVKEDNTIWFKGRMVGQLTNPYYYLIS